MKILSAANGTTPSNSLSAWTRQVSWPDTTASRTRLCAATAFGFGVASSALRFYEREGLIAARRTDGNQRRYPAVTLILTSMVVIVGIHAFLKMQRTEDPTVTIRTGLVAAMYPGATSEQVEKQVTKTLEKHIFKFPEVRKEKTYSTSRPGVRPQRRDQFR